MIISKGNLTGTLNSKGSIKGTVNNAVEFKYPALIDLEVTPSGEQQVFTHEGEFGYDKVTVEGVKLQNKTVTPTIAAQNVVADDSYSGLSQVTINPVTSEIDSNIQSNNIKTGVSILGVDGNLEPAKPKQNKEITPSSNEQIVVADEGYDLGQVTVSGDSDLAPQNIKEGANIFGVQGTAKVSGYEWAEFDPINVINLLDNDTEPYEYKAVVLLLNQGTNTYNIKYSDGLYTSKDIVKFSDGGELTIGGTQTYTFDESKDFINSVGQRVRYMVIYKKTADVSGKSTSYVNDILMWYFKKCTVTNGSNHYFRSGTIARTLVFDENCTLIHTSQNIASNHASIEKFIAPNQVTVSGKKLGYAFNSAYNLKEAKLNLNNEVNILDDCFGYAYSLRNIHLINCPNEVVSCLNFLASCYSLETFIAQPILIPTNQSMFFNNLHSLKKVSGIDFANFTTAQTLTYCKNLVEIDNVANININFNVSNCTQLSHQALINLFNALVDLTGQTAKTLTIGTVNQLKVTDEEKAIVTSKNWNLA